MKKLLIILLLFAACQKDEILQPEVRNVNIELFGAYSGTFDIHGTLQGGDLTVQYYDKDTLMYLINVNVNGLDHYTKVNQIVNNGFVGQIYFDAIQVKPTDKIKVSVKNLNYPPNSYVYLDIYSSKYHRNKIELNELTEVILPAFSPVLHIE